ncbi:MAG: transcription elongation factor GreB [Proteobacteria bacterium]|nr:MAG: transcription elongation factor GreB [Pseudomonadota bacterium]
MASHEAGKRYITPRGFQALQHELSRLLRSERPRVTREVADAAAQGDRSENAEYIYGKKRLREIDRRIEFLTKRLEELTVVRPDPAQAGRVFFGARVTLEDEAGDASEYQIVGPDEFDVAAGRIPIDSPIARALLGRRAGDEVSVQRPKGRASFTIAAIRYDDCDAPA